MCQGESLGQASRELTIGSGRLVHCRSCDSIGIEFGTSYLILSESEFTRFARWFETLRYQEAPAQKEKTYVRVQAESSVMLVLSPCDIQDLSQLLGAGLAWLGYSVRGGGALLPPGALEEAVVN